MTTLSIFAACVIGIAPVDAPPADAKPPTPPPTTTNAPAESQPDLLAGPSVADSPTRLTITTRNFDGTLQEIDPEPDVTAIGLLPLNESQRAKYTEVRLARLGVFDDIVRRNYGLILELASLQGKYDSETTLGVLERTRTAFEPFIRSGSFLDEMKPHLDATQVEQVNAMLTEYRDARVAELRSLMGQDATLRQIGTRARLEGFGQLVRQSVERQVGLAKETFDQLTDELNLTDDQRRRAEAILQPLAVKQFQRIDTAADRAEAYAKFREILNAEQKRTLLTILIKRWTPETDATASTSSAPASEKPPTESNPAMPN